MAEPAETPDPLSEDVAQVRRCLASHPHDFELAATVDGLLRIIDRLEEALREIAVGDHLNGRCQWCQTDISNMAEAPGHRFACPAAVARRTLALLAPSETEPAEEENG